MNQWLRAGCVPERARWRARGLTQGRPPAPGGGPRDPPMGGTGRRSLHRDPFTDFSQNRQGPLTYPRIPSGPTRVPSLHSESTGGHLYAPLRPTQGDPGAPVALRGVNGRTGPCRPLRMDWALRRARTVDLDHPQTGSGRGLDRCLRRSWGRGLGVGRGCGSCRAVQRLRKLRPGQGSWGRPRGPWGALRVPEGLEVPRGTTTSTTLTTLTNDRPIGTPKDL